MNQRHLLLIQILIIFLCISCGEKKAQRILIFTSRQGNMSLNETGMTSLKNYLETNQRETDTTSNSAYLTADSLHRFGTVVLLNLPQDPLQIREQNEIERFVKAGGGLVVIHATPSTRYQWPWFNEQFGFESGKADSAKAIQHNVVAAGKHKITDGLPEKWQIQDQLSSFHKTNDNSRTLLQTDQNKIISWAQEKEHGGIFATALGGTAEVYKDENFLKHIAAAIEFTLEGKALDFKKSTTASVPEENRFLEMVLDTYLDEPIEMEILSGGKVLFIERHGRVKLYDPKVKSSKVIATLQVQLEGNYEDGLLGLELDPKFDTNHFIYLYYSPLGGEPVQRLSRFKMEGDSVLLDSEKVVITVPVQRETCCHSAGNVYFGPDGLLYLSTGDNTSSKESDGFTPIDERPGRGPFDAQKSSGNTHDLRGKILRVKLNDDGTYSIPDGNLFPKDGSQGKPEIYVMGARNPYRITVDKRGFVYWGDVGPDGGEATERGPESYDEWNQARKPGNFGWPYFVGDNKGYADFDFATNTVGPHFDPANVLNESPNNYGSKKLPPAQPAMVFYPYGKSNEFPMLGTGSRSAMAGPFYYFDDYQGDVKLPRYYDNKMFIFEWARNWIKVLTFNEEGDLQKIEPFLPGFSFWHPIDMKFGPDGALYVLQYGSNYFARNPDAQLVRLEYAEGNRRPVAQIAADKTVGAVPLTVKLSAKNSFDHDPGTTLKYSWDSGNGQSSTEAEPTFRYEKEGSYTVSLTVTDEEGSQSTATTELKGGNETPVVSIDIKENTSFYFDNAALTYEVRVHDKEDGELGDGIEPREVRFSVDYLKEGRDLALLNSIGSAAVSAKHLKGKSLIDGSDCKSCHALEKKSVGPSYVDVAQRYKGQAQAVPMLMQKIIKGGGGNWGHAIMAAHPQLSEEDTKPMVEYILGLAEEQAGMPLKGSYKLNDHRGKGDAGSYVVAASYTDKGHAVTGPLTGRTMYVLRHPKVQAEDFDAYHQVGQQRPFETDMVYVSDIRDGSYIMFRQIDLKDINEMQFNVLANNGRVEIRSGSPEGPLLGTLDLTGTAKSWPYPWRVLSTKVKGDAGKNDLYLVFRNDEVKNRQFMGIDWIAFKK